MSSLFSLQKRQKLQPHQPSPQPLDNSLSQALSSLSPADLYVAQHASKQFHRVARSIFETQATALKRTLADLKFSARADFFWGTQRINSIPILSQHYDWQGRSTSSVIQPISNSHQILVARPANRAAIIDLTDHRVVWLTAKTGVQNPACSPNGRGVVMSWSDNSEITWHAIDSKEPSKVLLHEPDISDIVFAPDSTHFLAISTRGVVIWYDLATGQRTNLGVDDVPLLAAAIAQNGQRAITVGRQGYVLLHSLSTITDAIVLDGHSATAKVTCVAFSPDSCSAITADNEGVVVVHRFDLMGREDYAPLQLQNRYAVEMVCYSRDGTKALTAGPCGVQIHDLLNLGQSSIYERPEGSHRWVRAAAFSPDGDRFVMAGHHGFVRVISLRDGSSVDLAGHDDRSLIDAVAFTSDGKIVTLDWKGGLMFHGPDLDVKRKSWCAIS